MLGGGLAAASAQLMSRIFRRRVGLAAVAAAAALAGAMAGLGVGESRAADSDPPRVQLGHGSIGSYRWAVYAGRESRSGSPKRLCVITAVGGGPGSGAREGMACGPLTLVPNLLASSSGEGKRMRTVLGMAFPPEVRSVRLWLRGKKSRLIQLRQLSERQAKKAGLMRFRYATRAFAGPYCLQRFAYYDAAGGLIELTEYMGCPALRN